MGSRRLRVATSVLALATSVIAVFSTAHVETFPGDTLSDTLKVLDNAVLRLADPSSDYRKVMLDAVAALPADADDTVAAGVRTFLARAPKPGDDFKCSVDFVRLRARSALMRLGDALRHEYVAPLEPAVCYAAPFALDLTHAQTAGGWLDIYGYDFDRVIPQMVLTSRDGYRDVTTALVARSHYHLALKLGNEGVALSSESVSLGLVWHHLIHHSVPVIQPTARLCSTRIETIPAGRLISYTAPREGLLGGPRIAVRADATLDYSSNKLEGTICVTAGDLTKSGAVLGGCAVAFLYTTDPDRVIEGALNELTSQVSYDGGTRDSAPKNRSRNGLVRQWTFRNVGPNGSVAAGNISVTARLNELRLVSVAQDACVSPIAYLEAKRTTALDPLAKGSLDQQLKTIDPVILKLRPRFALPIP